MNISLKREYGRGPGCFFDPPCIVGVWTKQITANQPIVKKKTQFRIKEIVKQLREASHAYYNKDIKALKNKIKKYEDYVERLKKEGYNERLKIEKSFHIHVSLSKLWTHMRVIWKNSAILTMKD